jgi:acetyl esterase/lipase
MPAFLIPFFHRTNAIVVLPNYRLIPESTGADILSDLNDFWTWFHAGNVTKYLTSQYSSPIDLDYSRILVSGGSAGGYMALMTGLTQPQGTIKAILAQYPMSGHLNIEPSETFFGFPSPGPEVIDQHIASIRPGTIVSSATPPARLNLSYPMGAYNRYLEFFGYDKKLWPIHLIESKDWMPPTWIFHGDADSAVNIKDSLLFAEKWKKYIKGNECRLEVREGMEHGFDTSIKEDEEAWLREGLAWVEEQWLK